MKGLQVDAAKQRPRRREELFTSTVRGRFVVLDPAAHSLTELHPDIASLWPLLDGRLTPAELAGEWVATADLPDQEGLRIVCTVLEELSGTALLATVDD